MIIFRRAPEPPQREWIDRPALDLALRTFRAGWSAEATAGRATVEARISRDRDAAIRDALAPVAVRVDALSKNLEGVAATFRADVERVTAEGARTMAALRSEGAALGKRLAALEAERGTTWAHAHAAADIPHRHPDLRTLREEWAEFRADVEPRAIRGAEAARAAEEEAEGWEPLGTVGGATQYGHTGTGEVRRIPSGWDGAVEEGEQPDGLLRPVGVEMAPIPAGLFLAHFRREKKPAGPPQKETVIKNRPDPDADLPPWVEREGDEAGEGAGAPPEPATSPPRKRPGKGSVEEARKRRLEEQLGK